MDFCLFCSKDVAKYLCFETRFLENRVIGNQTLKKKKKKLWNSILLDSFSTWAFCNIFWAKGTNAHFGLGTNVVVVVNQILLSFVTWLLGKRWHKMHIYPKKRNLKKLTKTNVCWYTMVFNSIFFFFLNSILFALFYVFFIYWNSVLFFR